MSTLTTDKTKFGEQVSISLSNCKNGILQSNLDYQNHGDLWNTTNMNSFMHFCPKKHDLFIHPKKLPNLTSFADKLSMQNI